MTPTSQGHLAALVKAALDSMGINQAELARRLGVSESTVSSLLKRADKKHIPVGTIERLAEELPVSATDLLIAYAKDAGMASRKFDVPNTPYTAVVTYTMRDLSDTAQKRLAQIAQDFRDDKK